MRGRIDSGDLVMLREDAFECLDDDCTDLKGQMGEVIHVASILEGCELTIMFTTPRKMLLAEVPQTFVQHVAQG